MNLGRRHALCCGAALGAGLFSSLLAPPAEAALRNPCRGALPQGLSLCTTSQRVPSR